MSIFITSRPDKTIGGNKSRWNAVTNPVIFGIERQDEAISGTQEDSGTVRINLFGTASTLFLKGGGIGSFIHLKSGPYDEVGKVTSTGAFSITIDIAFQSNSSGGHINFNTDRANYRVQGRVLKIVGQNYVIIATTGSFRPTQLGVLDLDIRSWLKTLPEMKNEFQYDKLNEKDINLGGQYNFQIRELFQDGGGADPFEGEFPDPFDGNINFYINSARQIQQEHGGNMGQFTPFEIEVTEAQKMKFLSGFVEPTRFEGYPFDLQFIYNTDLESHPTTREERAKDINGVLTESNSDKLDNSQIDEVNRLTIKEGYDPLATSVDVFLTTDFELLETAGYATPGYVDEAYDGAPRDPINEPVEQVRP